MHLRIHKFKNTAHDDTHSLRLEYAKVMLINNNTLTQIAEAIGFSSSFHLSRAFKAWCGQTPAEFRKSIKQNN